MKIHANVSNKHVITRLKSLIYIIVIFGFIFIISPFLSGKAEGRTITVGDDSSADYSKIQEAINNSENADVIRVWGGTYYENIVIDKSLIMVGNVSPEVIIDGQGQGDVVRITTDFVNFTGFKCRNSSTSGAGIRLESDNNIINYTTCHGNHHGIKLDSSDQNLIVVVSTYENHHGIHLVHSNNNTISGSLIIGGESGIYLYDSSSNIIENNQISDTVKGIYIYYNSNQNEIWNNNLSKNGYFGIHLQQSCNNNSIMYNELNDKQYGLYIFGCSNNTLQYNIMQNNTYNFGIMGNVSNDFINQVDTSNLVNGKKVYYWVNKTDKEVPGDAGCIALINCSEITVKNQSIEHCSSGILIVNCENIMVSNNVLTDNFYGIRLMFAGTISINDNVIKENSLGIFTKNSIANNIAHNNQIVNNSADGINARWDNRFTIDATYNWWGSDSGPYHSEMNPDGRGDHVSGNVKFDPWIGKNETIKNNGNENVVEKFNDIKFIVPIITVIVIGSIGMILFFHLRRINT